jgi:predicted nucleic acid-binding protein
VIVVDASAILEFLLNTQAGEAVGDRLVDPVQSIHAPHLLDVEVLQVLRRYVRNGDLDDERCRGAIEDLADLPITRYLRRAGRGAGRSAPHA